MPRVTSRLLCRGRQAAEIESNSSAPTSAPRADARCGRHRARGPGRATAVQRRQRNRLRRWTGGCSQDDSAVTPSMANSSTATRDRSSQSPKPAGLRRRYRARRLPPVARQRARSPRGLPAPPADSSVDLAADAVACGNLGNRRTADARGGSFSHARSSSPRARVPPRRAKKRSSPTTWVKHLFRTTSSRPRRRRSCACVRCRSERVRSANRCGTRETPEETRWSGIKASAAGGPTRHPRVARPGGRAGGRGSARQRGGPQAQEDLMATTVHEAGRRIALERDPRPGERARARRRARPGARRLDRAAGHARPARRPRRRRRLRARRRLSPDRRRAVARPGRGAGRHPRRRDRGRRPRGREHHAQAAEPLRGGQGRPRDARPRPHRGRRRAGARLAEGPGHRAREDPRAARARAAADRRGRHPPGRRRPAARDRHGRARAARRRHRLPRRRQRLGRRAAHARARLGARRRAHARREQQGVRRLPAHARARTRSPSCGSARRPSSSTRRPRSCTSSSTATPTGRRRCASTTPTSTRRAPPAC